jgi:hypothetical protein
MDIAFLRVIVIVTHFPRVSEFAMDKGWRSGHQADALSNLAVPLCKPTDCARIAIFPAPRRGPYDCQARAMVSVSMWLLKTGHVSGVRVSYGHQFSSAFHRERERHHRIRNRPARFVCNGAPSNSPR